MFKFFRDGAWKRRLTQTISLVILGEWSLYGIVRCPFAIPYVSCGQCPVIQCPGRSIWMWSWIAIALSALLFGRAFCGWVCPGGLLAETLASLSIIKKRFQGSLIQVAAKGKYLMLLISLFYIFLLNNPRWAVPIRTGEFFNSIVLTFEHANQFWLWKTVAFLVLFFIIGIFIPRVWCRFLCPTGGLLEFLGRFGFLKTHANEHCTGCEACKSVCSMDTKPTSQNCTNCGTCIPICPAEAIHYSTARPVIRKREKISQ